MNKSGANAPVMLFDLEADPNETRDLAAARPEVVAEALRRMAREHVPSAPFVLPGADPRPTPLDD
jgi:hypothetical protein